ncbi:MAG: hypothetical protein IJ628_10040 [Bacteroidaceae bacterium]|nr:hypothetical protein [Bacteroidaceae bacterium]
MNILKGLWRVGDKVSLPYSEDTILEMNYKVFKYELPNECLCLREPDNEKPGILIKVMPKCPAEELQVVNGKAFFKDNKSSGFSSDIYSCYPFPSASEVKDVLGYIQNNEAAKALLSNQKIHLDPSRTYWIEDICSSRFFFKRRFQYYDPKTDDVAAAKVGSDVHHRLFIAYFTR